MRNKIIIVVTLILVVSGIAIWFFAGKKQPAPVIENTEPIIPEITGEPTTPIKEPIVTTTIEVVTSTPSSTTPTIPFIKPVGKTMEIISTGGEILSINNVYNKSIGDLSLNGVALKDPAKYFIAYYPNEQGFIITLKTSDVTTARTEAENAFLSLTGTNKTTACKLNVYLTVPLEVNADAAGKNFGLSFCPNGKPIK